MLRHLILGLFVFVFLVQASFSQTTCTKGTSTNLIEAAPQDIYETTDGGGSNKFITHPYTLIANASNYKKSGGNLVLNTVWRWNDDAPASASSYAMGRLFVNGTEYARLVTPNGDGTSATMSARNGATVVVTSVPEASDWSSATNVQVIVNSSWITNVNKIEFRFTGYSGASDDVGIRINDANFCSPTLNISKSGNGPWTTSSSPTYTLRVSNTGAAPTIGTTTIRDTLPAGVYPGWVGTRTVGGAGVTWSCTFSGQDIECVTNGKIGKTANGSFTLPVSISSYATTSSLTNYASIAGGTDPFNGGVAPTPGASCSDPIHCSSYTTDFTRLSQPVFGSCPSGYFVSQASSFSAPTQLYYATALTSPVSFNLVGTSSVSYNAIGFNPIDSYLYGIVAGKTRLARIGSDGIAVDLGAISGMPGGNYNTGEFGPDGSYYVMDGYKSNFYKIDIASRTAVAIPITGVPGAIWDWAWYDGYLYAFNAVTSNNDTFRIDPATGVGTQLALNVTNHDFGAMFGGTNGVFGASNQGGFYQLDPTDGTIFQISNSPSASQNDGARCGNADHSFESDLSATKTDGKANYTPGSNNIYTITITNTGIFGAKNVIVSDPLPTGITTASWTCSASGGATCTASGTGAIADEIEIPVNGTATYTLTMAVPSGFTGALENTVEVTPGITTFDPDTSNNISKDIDNSLAPFISLLKSCAVPTNCATAPQLPGTEITYSIVFSNEGGADAQSFVLTDAIPSNTDFKIGSATAATGTTGITMAISYSNDLNPANPAAATFTYTPVSGGGGAGVGFDRNVKAIRWTTSGALSPLVPNNIGSVGFTVRIQ